MAVILQRASSTRADNELTEVQLLEALANDPEFPLNAEEIAAVIRPHDFIGRCEEQVDMFLATLDLEDSGKVTDEDINL